MKYGTETIKAVSMHFELETPLREISRRFFVPLTTLHRWKENGVPVKNGLPVPDFGTPEHQTGNAEKENGTPKAEQEENAFVAPEIAVPIVPASIVQSEKQGFISRHFGLMDIAYYTLNGTAAFAWWHIAPGVVGACFAALHLLFSLDAILRVKRANLPQTAGAAANRVVFVEIIGSIAHANLINDYLWRNLDKLPFRVVELPTGGAWVLDYAGNRTNGYWQNGDLVGFIALALAALMCMAACHAVFFTKNAAKERAKIADKNAL